MCLLFILKLVWTQGRVPTHYLTHGVSMVTETSGTRTGTLDSEYENIGIIPIYFVLHWLLALFPRFLFKYNT